MIVLNPLPCLPHLQKPNDRKNTPQSSNVMISVSYDASFVVHATHERFYLLRLNGDAYDTLGSGSGCQEKYISCQCRVLIRQRKDHFHLLHPNLSPVQLRQAKVSIPFVCLLIDSCSSSIRMCVAVGYTSGFLRIFDEVFVNSYIYDS